MTRTTFAAILLTTTLTVGPSATARGVTAHVKGRAEDRAAIKALLATYTKAVSEKNEALFESILLDQNVAFSAIGTPSTSAIGSEALRGYPIFRQAVFHGPAFKQRFRNVHIQQHGLLAQVSLIFVNSSPQGSDRGWKTMQLVKTTAGWRVASELYTFP